MPIQNPGADLVDFFPVSFSLEEQKGAGFRGNRAMSLWPYAIPKSCPNVVMGVKTWTPIDNEVSTDTGPVSGRVVSSEVDMSQGEIHACAAIISFGGEKIGLLLV